MNRFLEQVQHVTVFHGFEAASALVLTLLTVVLLPRRERWRARGPIVFLALYGTALGLRTLTSDQTPIEDALEVLALLFSLFCVGRAAFLIIVHTIMPRLGLGAPKIFLDLVMGAVYVAALMITLRFAGVEPASILTGSALATAVIGLSLKDTLGNLFAGLAIHAQHPFEVDDWIQFDERSEHIGKVKEINWRATTVVTLDAVEVIVPNSKLADAPIRNFNKPERWSRRSIYFHAPYHAPTRVVQRAVLEAVGDSWGVRSEPAPSVVTHAFTERGVEYWLRFFTDEFDHRDKVDGGVRDRVWYALAREGIEMPPPQRHVELERTSAADRQRRREEEVTIRREDLRKVDLFHPLEPAVLQQLAEASRTRRYFAGETIVREGERGTEFYVLHQGRVKVTVDRPRSGRIELAEMGPGEIFGEMAPLTGEPRRATVRALDDCEVTVVSKLALDKLLHDVPGLAEYISKTLARRHAELRDQLDAAQRDDAMTVDEESESLLQRIREFFSLG